MTVFSYARVSTKDQAEGESLEAQTRQLQGWAMMHGRTIDQIVTEAGVSGSIPIRERPLGSVMMAGLRKGDTIVAVKLDRMFRSALDALQTVEELKAKGVSLVLLDLGGDVMNNGLAKMFLTIAAAFAEAERDRIRERILTAKADAKARGRFLGGVVPFGYVRGDGDQLEPVPAEQAILKRIGELRGSGATYRTIRATIVSETGRSLSLSTLSRIVSEAA